MGKRWKFRNRRHNKKKSKSSEAKDRGFLYQHSVGLISLIFTIAIACLGWWIATWKADIRIDLGSGQDTVLGKAVKDLNDNCVCQHLSKFRFKNFGWTSGSISDVKIINETPETLTTFETQDVDKSIIQPGEEKEVFVRFQMIMDKHACELARKQTPLNAGIRFFDNTGRLIDRDYSDQYFVYSLEMNFAP